MSRPAARSQTDTVIEGVKAMIADGTLRAGSRLPIEADLAAQLSVSRGSLREGVRALAVLGILETRQGAGTYVTSLDPHRLLGSMGSLADLLATGGDVDLLEVRRILESETAARAAVSLEDSALDDLESILDGADAALAEGTDRDYEAFIEADSKFHALIARASGNPTLAALVEGLSGQTTRARLWRAISARGSVEQTQAEHRAILEQLRRRDPERARLRMAVHVLGVEEYARDHPSASAGRGSRTAPDENSSSHSDVGT